MDKQQRVPSKALCARNVGKGQRNHGRGRGIQPMPSLESPDTHSPGSSPTQPAIPSTIQSPTPSTTPSITPPLTDSPIETNTPDALHGKSSQQVHDTDMQDTVPATNSGPIGKKFLIPVGKKGYYDNKDDTNGITNVLKSRLTSPFVRWSKIPQPVKDLWFEDWKKFVYWDLRAEAHMYSTFMEKMGERISGIYHDIRKSRRKPGWMLDDVYNNLRAHWDTEDYQAICERNKANRASAMGAPTYTGGSQSVHTIIRKKEATTGEKSTTGEAYNLTFAEVKDREKLVENLSPEDQRDQYQLRYHRAIEDQAKCSIEDPSFEPLDNVSLWRHAQGDPNKKGRMTGLNHLPKTPPTLRFSTESPTFHSPHSIES